MKWLKRLTLAVVFLAVFAGVLGVIGYRLARGTPSWYSRRPSRQQLAAAAARAESQIIEVKNWANEAHAVRPREGGPSATQPAAPSRIISFTEDELNGFFQKWDATFGWGQHYDQYLSDPQIVIQDDRLVLAAMVKEMGTVVSIEFAPRLEEGKLTMPVTRVLAGRLPLPRAFWDKYRDALERSVRARLPEWRQAAGISPDGTANGDAVAAGMSELLLDILNDRPAPPALFLPYSLTDGRKSLPVRITQLHVGDKTLTLGIEPMTRPRRDALLDEIRSFEARPRATDAATSRDPGTMGFGSQGDDRVARTSVRRS